MALVSESYASGRWEKQSRPVAAGRSEQGVMAQPRGEPEMSEYEHDEEREQEDLAGLRKAARDGKAAQQQLEQMRRELMFAKAGIDTDTKIGKMLFKTWEGDSLEDLRSEAEELGLMNPPTSRTGSAREDDDMELDDRSQQDFRRTVSAGKPAGAVETPSPDPTETALSTFHEDVRRGVPSRQAGLAAIDRILVAGANKDPRVIFDPNAWEHQARLDSASRSA